MLPRSCCTSCGAIALLAAAMTAVLFLSPAPFVLAMPSPSSASLSLFQAAPQLVFSAGDNDRDGRLADDAVAPAMERVKVTLGVMSRCPDALACEATFDKALDRINQKTRLEMSYIGTPNPSATYGVSCVHGDQECVANIQQLCLQHALEPRHAADRWDLGPSAAQRKWWNFIQCQNYAGLPRIGTEALAKRCLDLIDGPDWKRDGIEECANGPLGRKLLKDSVKRAHSQGIVTSCTILIEGRTRCVRDDGHWKRCDIGHEAGDFVAAIEKQWQRKNQHRSTEHLDEGIPVERIFTTTEAHHGSRYLERRQTAPSSSTLPPSATPTSNNNGGGGNGTPPSVFTLIIAIALFVLVVAFVLLRTIIRNRRLRRLGLLPDGPIDQILEQTREIEDTLAPPKLWEVKIAHDYLPQRMDPDAKTKGWDAVMPVSAALSPSVYADLFPNDVAPNKDPKGRGSNGGGDASSSYPPALQTRANMVARHMQLPGLLRCGGAYGQNHGGSGTRNGNEVVGGNGADPSDANNNNEPGDGTGDFGEKAAADNDLAVPASVNVTVLIAMPSPRTVFPSAQQGRKSSSTGAGGGAAGGAMMRQQASTTFPPLTRVKSTRLDEVLHEHDDDDDDQRDTNTAAGGLRRKASMKSFRTIGSTKSLAEARREAFFGAMADEVNDRGNDAAPPPPLAAYDGDDDEEELPELVFGTASVPIFCQGGGGVTGGAPTARKAFSERADTYQPIRQELLQLVASAHEARERKARNDVAAKEAEASKAAADDGHNAGGRGASNLANPSHVSSSETIDSDPGMGVQLHAMDSTTNDGLGDVVGRMMAQNVDHAPTRTSSSSRARAAPPLLSEPSDRPSMSSTLDPAKPRSEHPNRASTTTLEPLLKSNGGSPFPGATR